MTSLFYWYTEVQTHLPDLCVPASLVYIWLSIYFIHGIRKWLVYICVCLVYVYQQIAISAQFNGVD